MEKGHEKGKKIVSWLFLSVSLVSLCILSGLADAGPQYNLTCSSCHDMPPRDSATRDVNTGGFKGNHQTHQPVNAQPANCSACHNVAGFTTSHMDGKIGFPSNINNSPQAAQYRVGDVAVTFKNQTSVPVLGACTNVNCHFETGTPVWGSTSFSYTSPAVNDCDSCHGAPPAGTAGAPGSAGSHGKHDTYFNGVSQCKKCHTDHVAEASKFAHATSAGKRNLIIRLKDPLDVAGGTYSGPLDDYLPSQANAFGTCSNSYCHSPGTKNSSYTAPNQTATWGGTLGCDGCHAATPATGSHSAHVATSYGVPVSCYKCHVATVTAGMTISSTANHVNKLVNVAFNSTTTAVFGKYSSHLTPMQKNPGSGYANCENVYCHSNGQGAGGTWPPTYSAPKWGVSTTGKCGTCHDHGYHSGGAKINSGSHDKHMNYGFAGGATGCGICHYGAGFAEPACTQCHFGSNALTTLHVNHNVDVSFVTKFGGTYNGTPEPGNGYSTCANTYCHSDGKSTPTYAPAVTWGGPALSCTGCHGNATSNTLSGKHQQHLNPAVNTTLGLGNGLGCVDCHAKTVSNNTTVSDKTRHVNKYIDYSSTHGGGSAKYSTATKQCTNIYCHSNGNPASLVYVNPAAWNSTTTYGCNGCHGTSNPSTGAPDYATGGAGTSTANSHNKHVAGAGITDTRGCANCHAKTASQTSAGAFKDYTAASYHLNGSPNVYFKQMGGKTGTWNGSTCSNTYCHGAVASAAWGTTTSLVCNACHAAMATDTYWAANSAHKIHWQGSTLPTSYTMTPGNNLGDATNYRFACSSCHDKGSTHAGGPANANGAAEVFFGYTSNTMKGSYTYGATQGTSDNGFNWTNGGTGCNTSYCHSNGQGASGLAAVAWSTTASSGTCVQCHDTRQTGATATKLSGKHDAHLNPTNNPSMGLGNSLGCIDCHAKTVSSNTTIKDKSKHVNKFIDFSSVHGGGSAKYSAATHLCTNIYCHSNGNPASLVYVNPAAWNSTTTYGCNGCHGTSSSIGAPDYSNGGAGTSTANSHSSHVYGATSTTVCSDCHAKTASMTTTGRFKDYTAVSYHLNGTPNVYFNKAKAGTTVSWDQATGQCSNIACHGNTSATWGSTAGCLTCHAVSIGNRAAIGPQFSANSHHIQGTTVTGAHCYRCHWEANSDGTINHSYHHSSTSGAPVELVIYGAGTRPTTYTVGTTAVQYTANGTRTEMAKINTHCLGCHSAQNDTATPFGDGKTPKAYAWDSTSIGARYGDTTTTPWGKYAGGNVTPKNTVNKALSAHGNATANHGGWNTSETWPDTRNGTSIVLCFDCHNSHGSTVTGTTTSYASATANGGILKDTTSGKGGYSISYKPVSGGSSTNHNAYNPGAGLCFDCHLTAAAGGTPWGYNGTFGSTQQIKGYWDTAYFGPGTFGSGSRYSYKNTANMGGHFGASSTLSVSALKPIGGLCTPCHDPHGVSSTLGANKVFAVPLLKGTWLTSPYKEDVATADNQAYLYMASPGSESAPNPSQSVVNAYNAAILSYRIDQNTFASGTITQTETQFAGLCLSCHPKTSLTNGTNHTWKTKNRIHESVKGWKTANTTIKHSYPCSKCHATHNARLPRLMVTNCLNPKHRGRVANNTSPITSGSGHGESGSGSGHMPGSYAGTSSEGHPSNNTFTCHENNDAAQGWNNKTPW